MAKKKEKKAGKRMKKKELANILMDFFHTKQEEVISLKYLFAELHLTTHPLKMLCMDILADMLADDYITEVDKNKYKLNNHGIEMTGTFQRKSNGKNSFIPEGGGEPIFIAERNSAHAMTYKFLSKFLCEIFWIKCIIINIIKLNMIIIIIRNIQSFHTQTHVIDKSASSKKQKQTDRQRKTDGTV